VDANTITLTEKTATDSQPEEKPSLMNLLKNKSYRLVFGGQLINLLASLLVGMTLSYLIYDVTKNAALMAMMGIVGALPTILIILFAGVIIDRIDQKKMILITIVLRFIVFTLFLLCFVLKDFLIQEYIMYRPLPYGGNIKVFVSDYTHFIWPMYVALFISNAAGSLYFVTVGTYSKYIINKKDYLIANSFGSTIFQSASIIAPLLAGVLITVSYLYSFIIGACIMSFAVIFSLILVLKGIDTPKVEIEESKGYKNNMKKVFDDIRVGMDTIKSEPKILFITITYVIFNLACTSVGSTYNVILQGEMALSATWLGAISAAMAAIAVIASLIVMKIGKMKRKLILVFIFFSMQSIGLFLFAFNRNPWIMILINVLPFGIVNGLSNIPSNTLRQEKISHDKLGRVMSSVLLFISIANLLGNGIVTAVSNYVKPMYIVLSGAILLTLLTIGSFIVFLSKRSLRCSDYSDTEVVEEVQVEKIVPSVIDQIPSSRIDEFDILTKDTDKRLPFDGSVPSPSLD